MTTNRLLWVDHVTHSSRWIGHNLISYKDRNVELLTQLLNLWEHSTQDLLPLRKLSSTTIIYSEGLHDWVDNEERVGVFDHGSSCLGQECIQSIDCECSSNHDVVKNFISIEIISLCDIFDPFRSEGVLCVDVENLSLTATLSSWKLSCDTKSHCHLGLSRSEFSESLCDGLTLDTSLKEKVKWWGPCRYSLNLLSQLEHNKTTFERHLFDLSSCLKDFFGLCFRYTLDREHFFLGDHETGEHSAETVALKLQDVSSIDAMVLKKVNFFEG